MSYDKITELIASYLCMYEYVRHPEHEDFLSYITVVAGFGGLGVACRFKPRWSRWIFKDKKILGTPSFRGELMPSVPCRRFAACKRSLMVWTETPCRTTFLAHSSTFLC